MPGLDRGGGVGPHDQEQLGAALGQRLEGVDRVGGSAAIELETADLQSGDVLDGRLHHGGAVVGPGHHPLPLLPGLVGDDEEHAVEGELVAHVDGGDEVPDVDGVERAPEDTEAFGCHGNSMPCAC